MKKLAAATLAFVLALALVPTAAFAGNPVTKGDVNYNGVVNIVDAQLAYDIACGGLTDDPDYSKLRSLADVNEDGAVDSADARAIQWNVHHGNFDAPIATGTIEVLEHSVEAVDANTTYIAVTYRYTNLRETATARPFDDFSQWAWQDGIRLWPDLNTVKNDRVKVAAGESATFQMKYKMRNDSDVVIEAESRKPECNQSLEQTITVSGTQAGPAPADAPSMTVNSYELGENELTVEFTFVNKTGINIASSSVYKIIAARDGIGYSPRENDGYQPYDTLVKPGYAITFVRYFSPVYDRDITIAAIPLTSDKFEKQELVEQVITTTGESAQPSGITIPLEVKAYVENNQVFVNIAFTNTSDEPTSIANNYDCTIMQNGVEQSLTNSLYTYVLSGYTYQYVSSCTREVDCTEPLVITFTPKSTCALSGAETVTYTLTDFAG